ncbi:YsnF/AvaK domain-containing protein [Fibrella sp. HMF5335]|uniref:YsnF/AvaK domain-containing protein n=2 Tax=Fibrella rubiginis TaxID=2817060 RepID=A0A939K4U6_9BACT|nr:YsnF/AvaK domain-containing protein [Fibrella rubiginis]
MPAESTVVIPVIEEQVHVHKETDETGRIRISKQVFDDVQQVNTLLNHEEIDVQRIPFNEVVPEAPAARYEGDTYIIPVVREEVVTSIRYVLVEEIRVTKRQFQTVDNQTVTLRREAVTVERLSPTDDV